MSARSGDPFSEAREAARGMATTQVERVMIDAALALFLDKLRDTHVVVTQDEYDELVQDADAYEAACSAAEDHRWD